MSDFTLIPKKKKNKKVEHTVEEDSSVKIKNEHLNQLISLFPSVTPDVIGIYFAEHNYDLEKTIQTLQDISLQDYCTDGIIDTSSSSSSHEDEFLTEDEQRSIRRSRDSVKEILNKSAELEDPTYSRKEKTQFLQEMFPDCESDLILRALNHNNFDVKQTVEFLLPLSVLGIVSWAQYNAQRRDDSIVMKELQYEAPIVPEVQPAKPHWGPLISAWNGKVSPYVYKPKEPSTTEAKTVEVKRSSFETKVMMLAEMFPDAAYCIELRLFISFSISIAYRTDALSCRLEECNEDYEKTVESLLGEPPPLATNKKVPSSWNSNEVFGSQKLAWKTDELDMASKLRLQTLKQQFHWVQDPLIESVYQFNNGNVDKTREALSQMFPPISVQPAKKKPIMEPKPAEEQKNLDVEVKKFLEEERKNKEQNKFQVVKNNKNKKKQAKRESSWKDRASYHEKCRDEYFREATLAYLAGNREAAQDLSAAGRKHHKLMQEAQAKDADDQFQQSLQAKSPVSRVDLHGLLVKEALAVLSDVILKLQREQVPQLLEVITGAGHHSLERVAKIKPAVESFLTERGFNYREANIGSLIVLVTK